jgi:YidC/Oxa1 family membrane protein insertase
MQALQPLIQDIQKRYKSDKQKMNEEMTKLYSEHKVNPAGGCLPLLIQMPIILALYWVIVQPLKFMLGKSAEQIQNIVSVASTGLNVKMSTYNQELTALNYFNEHKEALSQVANSLSANELINFNFLGLKLGHIASYHLSVIKTAPEIYLPLLLLPIIGVVTTYIATTMAMPKTDKTKNTGSDKSMAMANNMTNSMKYMGPVMTLIFSFQLPAGVVLYWIAGYVFQIGQQFYINKFVKKKHKKQEEVIAAQMAERKVEEEKKRAEQKAIAESINENKKDKAKTGNKKKITIKTYFQKLKNYGLKASSRYSQYLNNHK